MPSAISPEIANRSAMLTMTSNDIHKDGTPKDKNNLQQATNGFHYTKCLGT